MKYSNESAQFNLHSKNQVSAHAKWRLRNLAMATPLPCETLSEFTDTLTLLNPKHISLMATVGKMENVGIITDPDEI